MAQILLSGSIGIQGSQSILGNVTVSMTDTNLTLTAIQWANKFINVVSSVSLTTTRNLIAPLNQGQEFTIQNNTTGGQPVTIIGASGTGITIANGQTASVICDGSNYVQSLNNTVVSTITFQPGGENGPTTFTNFTDICNYFKSAGSSTCIIYIDASASSGTVTIPAGTYQLPSNVSFIGLPTTAFATYGDFPFLEFAAETILHLGSGSSGANSIKFWTFQSINFNNTVSPNITVSGVTGFIYLRLDECTLFNNSATMPFISVTSGAFITCECQGSSEFSGSGGHVTNIAIDTNSFGEFFFYENAVMLLAGLITFTTGGSGACYLFLSSSVQMHTSYLITPFTTHISASAPFVTYTPGTPTNWPGDPTTVQQALDQVFETKLTGDVTGTANANVVTKIQGNNVISELLGSAQDGYVLTWDNSDGYWKPEKTGVSFTAGGDLSGTSTNQIVQSIQGINISGTPSIGKTLIATSSSAASWQSPVIPTGITSYGAYASRPTASGSDVLLYQTADGPVDYVNNGSIWLPKIPGAGTPGSEVAPGNTSPFTVLHSGSGTTINTVAGGCISISTTSNSSAQAVQLLQTSLTGNQGPQAWLQTTYSTVGSVGVFVRNTSSGNMVMFVIDMNGAGGTFLAVLQYSSQTADAGGGLSDINTVIKQPIGMRLRNDGTNWYAETSTDGISWRTAALFSIASSWYLGGGSNKGNACGICVNPYGSPIQATVLAYDVK